MIDIALNDFRFTLGKAIDGLVTQGSQCRAIEAQGIDLDRLKKAEKYKTVVEELLEVYDKSTSKKSSVVSSNAINLKITDVTQFKSYSVRMLKALKEDLNKVGNTFITAMNKEIDAYLQDQEDMKKSSPEELRIMLNKAKMELLDMRSHELFIKKITEQVGAFKEAFEFCDVELASQCFPNCKGSEGYTIDKETAFSMQEFTKR